VAKAAEAAEAREMYEVREIGRTFDRDIVVAINIGPENVGAAKLVELPEGGYLMKIGVIEVPEPRIAEKARVATLSEVVTAILSGRQVEPKEASKVKEAIVASVKAAQGREPAPAS